MPRHAVTAGHVVEPRVLKDLILSSEAKYELAWLDDLAGALAYEVVLGKPLSTADLPRVLLLRAHRPIPPALTAAAAATAGLTLPQLRARAANCADDFKTCLLSLFAAHIDTVPTTVILSSNIVHTLADVWTGALFGSTRMVGDVSTAYKLRLFTRGGVSEEVCLFASLSLRCTRGNLAAMTPFAPFALDWDQGTPLVWLGPYRFLAHTCAPATINSVYRQGGPGGASTRGLSIAPRALPPGVHVQFVVTNRAIPPSSPIHGITAHHGVLGCQCRAGAQAQAKAAAQTPQTAMPTLVASTTSLSEPLPADDDVELPFEDHQQQHELELLPLSPLPPLPDDTDSQAFDPTPTLTTLTTLAAPAPATPAAPFINTEEDIKPNIRKSNPDGHQQLVSRLRKYRRKVYKQKLEIAFLKGQLAGPSGKRPRFSAPSSSSSMSE